jgi:hypothetical protein
MHPNPARASGQENTGAGAKGIRPPEGIKKIDGLSLRGMTEEEFQAFLAESVPEYAAEKVKAGNWTPEEALEKSRNEHTRLLPEGLASLPRSVSLHD